MPDFKINDYVCRTVDGVDYIGRVRKKEEDDNGLRVWVQFTPPVEGRGADRSYIEFKPNELQRVAISVNPPTCEAVLADVQSRRLKPRGIIDLIDFDNPVPKTER